VHDPYSAEPAWPVASPANVDATSVPAGQRVGVRLEVAAPPAQEGGAAPTASYTAASGTPVGAPSPAAGPSDAGGARSQATTGLIAAAVTLDDDRPFGTMVLSRWMIQDHLGTSLELELDRWLFRLDRAARSEAVVRGRVAGMAAAPHTRHWRMTDADFDPANLAGAWGGGGGGDAGGSSDEESAGQGGERAHGAAMERLMRKGRVTPSSGGTLGDNREG